MPLRRSRVVHALDHEAEAVHVEDPEVPPVARALGEEPGVEGTVDLALGDVSRHLQVDVLAGISGKRDVDWIRHVEERMIREGVGKIVDARSDRDVRRDRVFGPRARIAQQPGAPADEQTCLVAWWCIVIIDQRDRSQDPSPAIGNGERHPDGVVRRRSPATHLEC